MSLLVQGDSVVHAVARAVGFDSMSAFSRAFLAYTGQTPTAFRRDRREAEGSLGDLDHIRAASGRAVVAPARGIAMSTEVHPPRFTRASRAVIAI